MDLLDKAAWLADRLVDHFGMPKISRSDPVETLVLTILSQNTNDTNRDRAYGSLLATFKTFDAIRTAPIDAIAESIRVGGLHRQKADAIHRALHRIHSERGGLDLSFLGQWDLDAAMRWLLASPGVGKKTAGIIMLFSFGKPYFPVDTHIRRVFTRFGLVKPKGDPHEQANTLLPDDAALMSTLHLLVIRLGREICHPRTPSCSECPIRDRCNKAGEDAASSAAQGGLT